MTERRKTGRWRPDSVGKKKAGTNSMTIVIAARRDEEALLLADTMIGNRGERRNDVVPGPEDRYDRTARHGRVRGQRGFR
jgi:hypothetical protein